MAYEKINQRREELHQETGKIFALQQCVQDAQNCEDYLQEHTHFHIFHRRGVDAIIRSFQRIPNEYADWAFDLTSRNMKQTLSKTWGWSDAGKHQELFEEDARFLIAVCNDKPIGFVHFRFEQQNGEFVLFIYDIQIEPDFQGRGLGMFLADACWFIALKKKASCLLTLVFKANEDGMGFFKSIGYLPHAMSPEQIYPDKESQYQHMILYKSIKKWRPAESSSS
ncbi:N-alpha-acetyltransferase 40 [Tritrichomonas foetus]|uniref:N-alpha-acetyltransferase 40 n=1 Tax=Tritrichomonas foetus TaxID=1144522 RepID=A0A1J4KCR8_9EUKA|nr:N-alpha-acetyltransferase 40 [Tritrichomonas foetus]|eukprot:OHT09011.1 N-alpha-acetyltransferase 40 [Tritrichomonas foetus]